MPPAFLFLIPAMSNSWALGPARSGAVCPAPEVAAYMGRPLPRQHPFLRFLQKIAANRETCNFQRRTGCLVGAVGHRLDR